MRRAIAYTKRWLELELRDRAQKSPIDMLCLIGLWGTTHRVHGLRRARQCQAKRSWAQWVAGPFVLVGGWEGARNSSSS